MGKSKRYYMEIAIKEASRCQPEDKKTHPKVGAVIVKHGKILACTYRGETYPGDHAEFTALEKKIPRRSLAGATLYTTLEPCTTRKHPKIPCANRIVERKMSRVVIGMLDPNQKICGRGLRKLREANIVTELFPGDLMAEVEEQNRDFIRFQGAPSIYLNDRNEHLSVGIEDSGLTAFYPSRDYYQICRGHASSIDKYIAIAKKSIYLISINLMTGLPFDGLCEVFQKKLERYDFFVLISLLNPRNSNLVDVMAPVLDCSSSDLALSIRSTLKKLLEFKQTLSPSFQSRFDIMVHKTIPFGSAIMIDHKFPTGRIQIETKPYKAPLRKSFAFEISQRGKSGLFRELARGYDKIIKEGCRVDISFLS